VADAMVSLSEGVYLAAAGDRSDALDLLEHGRSLCAECGFSMIEQVAGSSQVSLLIEKGDLPAARRRMIEAIDGHIRAGDHLSFWLTLHQLVRLLTAIGRHNRAAEIWAELTNRGGWADASLRADLETRLGPLAEPHLTDDELITRVSTLINELD
jgi:hypothetical protein